VVEFRPKTVENAPKRAKNCTPGQFKKKKLPKYVLEQDGEWKVRRTFPTNRRDDKGRLIYIQVKRTCEPQTEERAKAISRLLEQEFEAVKRKKGVPTVETYLSGYLTFKRSAVARRTYEMADDLFKRYVKNTAFGHTHISDIKVKDVQAFYGMLMDDGRSPAMVRKLHLFLSTAFNQAVAWDDLVKNPTRGVILPKTSPVETRAMTAAEAKKFIAACRKSDDCVIFELALETGMRPGEYLALAWKDVDLNKQTIRVRRAVAEGFVGGGFEIKEPKTPGSHRTISFSDSLKERLLKHKEKQDAWIAELQRDSHGKILLSHMKRRGVNYERRKTRNRMAREALENIRIYDLVVPGEYGAPMSKGNLNRRQFKAVVKAAGLDQTAFSLYSLRHTAATLSIAAGVNLKAVAEKLGHTDVTVLLRTYSHVLPSMREDATAKLADMLY
jgi:integrase